MQLRYVTTNEQLADVLTKPETWPNPLSSLQARIGAASPTRFQLRLPLWASKEKYRIEKQYKNRTIRLKTSLIPG